MTPPPLRGQLCVWLGSKLIRYGARLVALGLHLDDAARLSSAAAAARRAEPPADYPRQP